jgi:hypothetical protein
MVAYWALFVSPRKKKNKIKKGQGADGVPDPCGRDNYPFEKGYFYTLLKQRLRARPLKPQLMDFCAAIEERTPTPLPARNRWAKRRLPNAYGWLDECRESISPVLVDAAFAALRINVF